VRVVVLKVQTTVFPLISHKGFPSLNRIVKFKGLFKMHTSAILLSGKLFQRPTGQSVPVADAGSLIYFQAQKLVTTPQSHLAGWCFIFSPMIPGVRNFGVGVSGQRA